MAKTIIESKITDSTVVVDGQTGEVLQNIEHSQTGTKTIRSAEPPYVKFYIEDMLYMSDMPKTYTNLTYELIKRATYANEEEGLCVSLTPYTKSKICTACGWDKLRSLNNALTKLVKGGILKRLGTGTYQLNPYLFGKGEWRDIENIRMTWEYNMKGRTFATSFTYKEQAEEAEEVEQEDLTDIPVDDLSDELSEALQDELQACEQETA